MERMIIDCIASNTNGAIKIDITSKEWFSGMAMQAMLSNPEIYTHYNFDYKSCALEAVRYANALIEVLKND